MLRGGAIRQGTVGTDGHLRDDGHGGIDGARRGDGLPNFMQVAEGLQDEQVRAALPNSAIDVSISKTPHVSADGTVWTCIAFYTEVINDQRHLRVQTV